jgi:hypothetical protein
MMSAKKYTHTDECLLAARQDERRRKSQEDIYKLAGQFAVTLLTRIKSVETTDEALEDLTFKLADESSCMALTLWDLIDDHTNHPAA